MDANRPNRKITTQEARDAVSECGGNQTKAAKKLGVARSTIRDHMKKEATFERPETLASSPDQLVPIEDLVENRGQEYERYKAIEAATANVAVNILIDGPVAVTHIGDPHIDSPGTNIKKLAHDLRLIGKTKGAYAVNLGDNQDNWVERATLKHLAAQQSTTAKDAWRLVEWMMGLPTDPKTKELCWLFLISGNHDAWVGTSDPLEWIANQAGVPLTYHGIRFTLKFPNGREVTFNERHDFAGFSMWNDTHAMLKAAKMAGTVPDNVYACGHRHISASQIVGSPADVVSNLMIVSGYKEFDEFPKQRNMTKRNIEPSCTTIINPDASSQSGLVQTIWNIENAMDYLTFLRKKKRA